MYGDFLLTHYCQYITREDGLQQKSANHQQFVRHCFEDYTTKYVNDVDSLHRLFIYIHAGTNIFSMQLRQISRPIPG